MKRRGYPAMTSACKPILWTLAIAALSIAVVSQALAVGKVRAKTFGKAQPNPASTPASTASSAEGIAFFEKKIRPVLAETCYKCHSATSEKIKGGLVLDTREGSRKGGDTGPAVVPGNVKASLIIAAIQWQDKDLQMPPKKKLTDEQIADFVKWVQMGAPDPREGKAQPLAKHAMDIKEGRKHWAYQPITHPSVPSVKDAAWPRTEIDKFVLAELEERHLKPVADADKRTLIRRLYFDLIGLPPTPQQVAEFLADTSAGAVEKVVDHLLASPQYGERWGRHWLDVARFAESTGKERNASYPHAWRYRDWVIEAFNTDKPYDRFILEQIAGDLLPARDDTQKARQFIATGYLAIGPKSVNTRDVRQFRLDIADEQIDSISQGLLGMTVACARCHDHKFDPIPTSDYYALAGIFMSSDTRYGGVQTVGIIQSSQLIELPQKAKIPAGQSITVEERKRLEQQLAQATKQRDETMTEFRSAKSKGKVDAVYFARIQGVRGRVTQLEKQLECYNADGSPRLIAMGVVEGPRQFNSPIYTRGEVDKPGDLVPRGVVQVINYNPAPAINPKSSGRLELAKWIASPANPMTARVMVNRIWEHLFGRGIVASVDNFGVMGQAPSHPELLDYLARGFIANGWSIKKTIRQIVLSRAYQLDSSYNESNYATDPDNTYLWRMSKRRLEAEVIRDSMLAVCGQLDLTPGVSSPVAKAGEGFAGVILLGGNVPRQFAGAAIGSFSNPVESKHRSIYLPILRDQILEPLAVFDFAEASLVTGQRQNTTVPSQALYLLNSPLVIKYSQAMAQQLLTDTARSDGQKIAWAFQLTYGRDPSAGEMKAAGEFFAKFPAAQAGGTNRVGLDSWTAFCQSLLAAAEFRYVN